jgi:hypothetical protein
MQLTLVIMDVIMRELLQSINDRTDIWSALLAVSENTSQASYFSTFAAVF